MVVLLAGMRRLRILRRWSVLPQRLLGLREVLLAMGLLGQRLPLIGLVLPGQLSLPLAGSDWSYEFHGGRSVEPEHDPRAGPGGFPQLGQRLGQRDTETEGSPVTKHTARPSCAVTWVSARPRSARPRWLFQPFATGLAPV